MAISNEQKAIEDKYPLFLSAIPFIYKTAQGIVSQKNNDSQAMDL